MSEIVEVTLGGQEVSVTIEGGGLGLGMINGAINGIINAQVTPQINNLRAEVFGGPQFGEPPLPGDMNSIYKLAKASGFDPNFYANVVASTNTLNARIDAFPLPLSAFGIAPFDINNLVDQSVKVQQAMDAGITDFSGVAIYIDGPLVWRANRRFIHRGSGEIFPKTDGFENQQGVFVFGPNATRTFEQSIILDDPCFVHLDAVTPPVDTGNPTADTEAARVRIAAWADNGLCGRFLQDTIIRNGLIVGFKTGYKIHQERIRLENCRSDNLIDCEISDASDCCYVDNLHMYPFWLAHYPGIGADALRPYERGIWLHDDPDGNPDKSDGVQVRGGLCYGRLVGVENDNCYATVIDGIFVDGPPEIAAERGTVAFRTNGDSNMVKITNCHAESVAYGYDLIHTGGEVTWQDNTASNIQIAPVVCGTGHSTGSVTLSNTGTDAVVVGLDGVGLHDVDVVLVGGTVGQLVDTTAVTTDKTRLRVRMLKNVGAATVNNGVLAAITPEMFGAIGDGVVDDHDAIENWLVTASETGKDAITEVGKTYLVGAPVVAVITRELRVQGAPGTTIKGAVGDGLVVEVRCNDGVSYPNFTMRNVEINNSLRTFVAAEQGGTALSLVRLGHYDVQYCRFVGDPSLTKGDAGTTATLCKSGVWSNNYAAWQPDLAFYPTGGNDETDVDDFGDVTAENNRIYQCDAGIFGKRQIRRLMLRGNTFTQTRVGILNTPGSGTPTPLVGAREQIVEGNIFIGCSEPIRLELSRGDIVAGNQIIDWGYDRNGVATAVKTAIRIFGVQTGQVVNNMMLMRELADAGHRGISLHEKTFGGVTTQSTGNIIADNSIIGCTEGVIELNSTTGNLIRDNITSSSVTTPVTLAVGSTSSVTTMTTGGVRRHLGVSSTSFRVTNQAAITGLGYVASTTVSIAALAAGAEQGVAVAIPGVGSTHFGLANCNFALPTGVVIKNIRCTTDTVTVTFYNGSASPAAISGAMRTSAILMAV